MLDIRYLRKVKYQTEVKYYICIDVQQCENIFVLKLSENNAL